MDSKAIYHCVYRITNLLECKHYYGTRSCKIHPSEDLGINYFSSSYDKEFKQDQLDNPQNYKYKVIRIFDTREEAVKLEIKLHARFDVGRNPSFYNKAKQTSTGWDHTGSKHSKETKIKISNSHKGKVFSEETRIKMSNSRKGIPRSEETKRKISESNKGKVFSEEARIKMSEAQKRKTLTETHKEKISNSLKGVTKSDETKRKMSEARKGKPKPKRKCKHCGIESASNVISRWHDDKCKNKK